MKSVFGIFASSLVSQGSGLTAKRSIVLSLLSLSRSLFSSVFSITLHATHYSLHAVLKIPSSYFATRYTLHATRFLLALLFVTGCTLLNASHASAATTTLETSTSTDPSSIIIGPGTSATTTNSFTFTTDTGTDVITAVVVAISSASSTSKVEITSNDGSTVYGSSTNPTGTTTSITLNNATLTATTATTTYKIRVTAKTQANLPVGNQGGLYPIVAFVQSWSSTNTKVGSDSANTSVIIDNLSLPNFGFGTNSTSFATKADYTTGTTPVSVVIGDLNNDGKMDFTILALNSNILSIFLNTSTTTFSFASNVDYTTGTTPSSVAIGDLNNDGKMDLAVANSGTSTVSIFLNTSTSTFSLASKVDFTTGSLPQSVAIGDLNGDGKMDLAVANQVSNTVSTFLNTSTSTFSLASKVDFTTGSGPYSVAIRDIDNEGKMDIVVANQGSDSVSIFLNTSTSTFSLANKLDYTTADDPRFVTTGDLNNDGKMDLVVANYGSASVSTFLNTSTSTFSLASKVDYTTGTFPRYVAIGDLNNDGIMDLAVANSDSNSISTFLNTSTSTFSLAAQTTSTIGSAPSSVAIGDLNYDGKMDLAITSSNSNTVSTFLNTSIQVSSTYGDSQVTLSYTTPPSTNDATTILVLRATSTPTTLPSEGSSYTAGNTIGNATVVIATSTFATSTSYTYIDTGLTNGTPYYYQFFTKDSYGNYSLSVIPLNSPVTPNIYTTLTSSTSTDPSSIIIGPGTSATSTDSFTFTTDTGTDVITAVVVALSSASSTSKIEITSNDGSTVYGSSTNPTGTTTSITLNNATLTATTATTTYKIRVTAKTQANLPVGNQGGLYPIVAFVQSWSSTNTKVGSDSANTSVIIDNLSLPNFGIATSSTSFASKVDSTTGNQPDSVVIGDINNDGKMDLVVANANSASVSIFLNTSTSTFSLASKVDYTTGTSPYSAVIGDLNNDGKMDLVVANANSNSVSVFLNTSTSTFSLAPKVDYTAGTGPSFVSIGDLNSDGKMDFATANVSSSNISIFLNTSTSTFSLASKVDYTTGTNPWSVAIGDLNSDGKMDLAVANINSNTTSIFLNTSTSTFSLASKVDYTTGVGPRSVAIGDLNSDGKMDLAVTNNSSNSVSIFLNTSTSTFSLASKVDYTTGTNPYSVAIGDHNNDGKMDLAVANYGSASVSTFLNTSTSTFSLASKVDYTTGTFPRYVAIGDLNNDGKMDLAVANWGSASVSTFLNSSIQVSATYSSSQVTLSYTTPPTTDATTILALRATSTPTTLPTEGTSYTVGNALGNATVLIATSTFATSTSYTYIDTGLTNGISYYYQFFTKDTYGNYSLPVNASPYPTTPNNTTSLTSSTSTDPSSLIIGPGTSATTTDTFTFQTDTGTDVITAVVVSLSSASSTSLVEITSADGSTVYGSVANPTGPSTTITLNNATLTATTATTTYKIRVTPKTQPNLPVGNQGGLYPLVAYIQSWTSGNVKEGYDSANTSVIIDNLSLPNFGIATASTTFATKQDKTTGTWPYSVAIGDLNNDGKMDLAVANYSSASVSTFLNTSTSTFSLANAVYYTTGTQPRSVAIGDLNNDTKMDLVVANYGSASVSTFLNTSTSTFSLAPKVDYTAGTNPYSVAIGDLNNDGKMDLAVANYGLASISTFLNTSTSTFSLANAVYYTTGTNPVSVAIGDLDSDGNMDIAVTNTNSSSVSTFLNTSTSTFSLATRVDYTTIASPQSVAIGDLNNDNKKDLVVISYNPAGLSIFFNTSTSTFSLDPKVDYSGPMFATSIVIRDLNNDGKMDLVAGNGLTSYVSTFLNTSTSTFSLAPKVDYTTGTNPYSVAVGDLNNDGKLDLAVANQGSATVSTFLNFSPQTSATAGDAQVTLSYTTPPSTSDATTILALRATSTPDTLPSEGSSYTVGNTLGNTTVVIATSTFATSTSYTYLDTGVTNGISYYYQFFTKDTYGNYSLPINATGSPVIPLSTSTTTLTSSTSTDPSSLIIGPGTGATTTNTFTFRTDVGTDTVTSVTVALSNASSTSLIEITNSTGDVVYGSTSTPSSGIATTTTVYNFESANLSPLTTSGNGTWTASTANKRTGAYGAVSGVIGHSSFETLQLVNTFTATGTIVFSYSVSSESGYDYLRFYIDGALQGAGWSGIVAWATSTTYTLSPGTHTFTWVYSKDSSATAGSDQAYVDDIVITQNGTVIPSFIIPLSPNIISTTSTTTYNIRITPKSQVDLPMGSLGLLYPSTSYIESWTGVTINKTGTDSANVFTIDNQSLADLSNLTVASSGINVITSYTTSSSTDVSQIIILSSLSAVTAVPVDGTNYFVGNTIGSSTVACIDSTIATSTEDSCSTNTLPSLNTYYFKAFIKDAYGNYSLGVSPSGIPLTLTTIPPADRIVLSDGIDSATSTIAPGDGATIVDSFSLQANATSTATLSNITVQLNQFPKATGSEVWTRHVSANETNLWRSITYGNGLFVAVADSGTNNVMTSLDGIIWTARTSSNETNGWNSVTYGNGLFVAVASAGTNRVMTSSDGITWTGRTSANEANQWTSVTYGNGLFVAVSYSGTNLVMTSPDGVTWTARTSSNETNGWTSVTYGNGLFVAVANSGTSLVMTSPNGINWTGRTSSNETNNWSSVTYGNGLFVAVATIGVNLVMTSPDGITWTARTSTNENNFWLSVTYGNGLFVAVALAPGTDPIMTSTDGISWTPRTSLTNENFWTSVTYGNGTFVSVAEFSGPLVQTSSVSPNFATSTLSNAYQGVSLIEIISNDGAIVYGSASNPTSNVVEVPIIETLTVNSATSSYKIRITPKPHSTMPSPSSGANYTIGARVLSFVQSSGIKEGEDYSNTFTIDNKINEVTLPSSLISTKWETATTTTGLIRSITYGNGLFVAVSDTGTSRVITSPDGITWTPRTSSNDTNGWRSVTYGNGLFVAVAEYGTNLVMTSSDGINWIGRTSADELNTWYSVTYGNGLFVAVAPSGTNTVMTSPDGITWTGRAQASGTNSWDSVTYGNGLFVAVTQSLNNLVQTSPDGINWTAHKSADENNTWSSVTYGNGRYVAVALGGTNRVMTSLDGATWTSSVTFNGSTEDVSPVTFGEGRFFLTKYATSTNTTIAYTSVDGLTWTSLGTVDTDALWSDTTTFYRNGTLIVSDGSSPILRTYFALEAVPSSNQVSLNLRTPSDSDIEHLLVLQNTSAVTDVPTEGTFSYATGTFIGTSRIACSYAVTGDTDYTCNATEGVYNGTSYYYKVFMRDSRGNYSTGVPITPSTVTPGRATTITTGTTTPSLTLLAGATATTSDTFTLKTDVGIDVVSAVTVTLATSSSQGIALLEITSDDGLTVYGSSTNPTLDVLDISLSGLTVTDTETQYRIRITPKTHANMLSVPGAFYSFSSYISSFTSTNLHVGKDESTAVLTIDNLSPASARQMGVDWEGHTSADDANNWYSVTYGNGLFVAVANSGTSRVMTSSDGITWTARTPSNDTNGWVSVTYGNGLFIAVANSGTDRVMTSPDGITWTGHTSSNETNAWYSVTYGNGLFVAVAHTGTELVMTSSDGITWTAQTSSNEANQWYSVTYGNGIFVAVSLYGTNNVMTSLDGVTWTGRTSSNESNWWSSITYGNGLFVAVANSGSNLVMTSRDGITWTGHTSANENNSWTSITYGNGLFVAVAPYGTNKVMTSPDGITWSARTSSTETNRWTSVTYGNGKFVGVASYAGTDKVMTSSSPTASSSNTQIAVTFTTPADTDISSSLVLISTSTISFTPTEGSTYATSTTLGNATALCSYAVSASTTYTCTATGLTNGNLYYFTIFSRDTSGNWGEGVEVFGNPVSPGTNVVTLTSGSTTPSITLAPSASATTSDAFTFQTDSGTDSISSVTVTLPTGTAQSLSLIEITNSAGNTVYGSVANPSTDTPTITLTGLTANTTKTEYRIRVTPKTHANMPAVPGSVYNVTTYISNWAGTAYRHAGSDTDNLASIVIDNKSPESATLLGDGINWTARTSPANGWNAVTYGNGLYVAVADSGTKRVMTSPDGITWTGRTSAGESNSWNGVTYGNGLFVAVAFAGVASRAMTSPDGITWTSRTVASNTWASVAYGNGTFVAVSYSGTNRVTTSTDGITWTPVSSAGESGSWRSVIFANGQFVAVGNGGAQRVMTSTDGATWTLQSSSNDANGWYGVTYGKGLYVAVAQSGTNRVMTSPDAVTWTGYASSNETNQWFSVAYGNGQFTAVSYSGTNRVMTSPNGSVWTGRPSSNDANQWVSVVYNDNGTFTAVAYSGTNRVQTSSVASQVASSTSLTINFATPASDDIASIIVIGSTTSNLADTPTEGSSYATSSALGGSTVVCSLPTITSTTTTQHSCIVTGLTNGVPYYYRVFTRDLSGNWGTGVSLPEYPIYTGTSVVTLANGTALASKSLYPSASATSTNSFTLITSSSTVTLSTITVSLGTSTYSGISLVEITNTAGNTVYGSVANPSTDTPIVSLSGLTASTTSTEYRIRITPKTHVNMPTVPGSIYSFTPSVIDWVASTGIHAGSNSTSTTLLTIDNLSPSNPTSLSKRTSSQEQIIINYTNPSDTDATTTLVLRSNTNSFDTPVEGTLYSVGNTLTTSVVACIKNSITPGTVDSCTYTTPARSTRYYFKVFTQDKAGNYSTGALVSPSPSIIPSPAGGGFVEVFNGAIGSSTGSGVFGGGEANTGTTTTGTTTNSTTTPTRKGGGGGDIGLNYQGSSLAIEESLYSSFFNFVKSAFTGNAPTAQAQATSTNTSCLIEVFGVCLVK